VLAEFVKRKSVEISFNIQRKQNESNARWYKITVPKPGSYSLS
jgi:hypothetical protein